MRVIEPHQFKSVIHRKPKKPRKNTGPLIIVAVAIVYAAVSMLRPLPAITSTAAALAQPETKPVTIAWPKYGQAAIGAVGYGVLGIQGTQKPLPMASVAKVMTALAVLKQRPLKVGEEGPKIVITQADVDDYYKTVNMGGSNVPVTLGEEISEYEALQALMLPSANNMANTLVRWAYGSEEKYVDFVNSFAQSLGMQDTHFADASGFSSKTISSSQDLARLAVNAMDNPVLAEIAAQPEATIPMAGRIFNVNQLLGRDGIVGVKTGNTDEAGGCFMAAAVRQFGDQKIIAVSVIMGAPNLEIALRDSVPLVNSVLDGFEQMTVVKAGQQVGTYSVPWDGSVNTIAKQDISGVVWRGNPGRPEFNLKAPNKPAPARSDTGTVTVSFGRKKSSSKVVLEQELKSPPVLWRLMPRF